MINKKSPYHYLVTDIQRKTSYKPDFLYIPLCKLNFSFIEVAFFIHVFDYGFSFPYSSQLLLTSPLSEFIHFVSTLKTNNKVNQRQTNQNMTNN